MTLQASQDRLDYRFMLSSELLARRRRNPSYSLRAFARALGVSAPYLSQVLSSKRCISERAAARFGRKLMWPARQRRLFMSLVQLSKATDEESRAAALSKVKDLSELEWMELRQDQFQLIAEWHHFAIVELTGLADFDRSPEWIGARLGIAPKAAREAIERLLRVGLLTEADDGSLRGSNPHYGIKDVPSEAIRAFHLSHLRAAAAAMEAQEFGQRDFSGTTVAVDRARLPEIKELIRQFRNKLNKHCGTHSGPDSVYQLSVQFFRLDREKP